MLERETALSEDSRQVLDQAHRAVADAQHEIRNFSYMLHPPHLRDEGLEKTLRRFAAGLARRTGLSIRVRVARNVGPLAFPIQVALFRVTQEGLMNVYRHAHASSAGVRLMRVGADVVLEVEDDGVGLPPGRTDRIAGVGISGMQARMTQLGGRFELIRRPVGTKVRASIGAGGAAEA
jgi:signal transduction histidine kinase